MQSAPDVLSDIVRVHRRLDLDQIGNVDDANQSLDGPRGGFLRKYRLTAPFSVIHPFIDSDPMARGENR